MSPKISDDDDEQDLSETESNLNLVRDTIRNYFALPWYELSDDDRVTVGRFFATNLTGGEERRADQNCCLLARIAGNRLEPVFEIVKVKDLKRVFQNSVTDRNSILFFNCPVPERTQASDQPLPHQPAQIRWVTDDEAVTHLAQVLRDCPVQNGPIIDAYRQLERFVDREKVLKV